MSVSVCLCLCLPLCSFLFNRFNINANKSTFYHTKHNTHKHNARCQFGYCTRNIVYILVLPAASSPSIKIRISLLPKIFDSNFPILMSNNFLLDQIDLLWTRQQAEKHYDESKKNPKNVKWKQMHGSAFEWSGEIKAVTTTAIKWWWCWWNTNYSVQWRVERQKWIEFQSSGIDWCVCVCLRFGAIVMNRTSQFWARQKRDKNTNIPFPC